MILLFIGLVVFPLIAYAMGMFIGVHIGKDMR